MRSMFLTSHLKLGNFLFATRAHRRRDTSINHFSVSLEWFRPRKLAFYAVRWMKVMVCNSRLNDGGWHLFVTFTIYTPNRDERICLGANEM